VIGNSGLRTSNFGTPNSAYVTPTGVFSSANYLHEGLVATNFDDTIIVQAGGDIAFVVEGYFGTPNMSFSAARMRLIRVALTLARSLRTFGEKKSGEQQSGGQVHDSTETDLATKAPGNSGTARRRDEYRRSSHGWSQY